MDNLRGLDRAVAVRRSFFIYHGRLDPYSAGNCNYSGAGTHHSRAEDPVSRGISSVNG